MGKKELLFYLLNKTKPKKSKLEDQLLFVYKNRINKEKISYEIEKYFEFSESGITNEKREFDIVISLTSYPDRMKNYL